MLRGTRRLAAALGLLALIAGGPGCASSGGGTSDAAVRGTAGTGPLVLGASLSLTGSLAREGVLTQEGYDLCKKVVNDKGGVPVGDRRVPLDIQYQDDTSKPDVAARLVDQFNGRGVKLVLGPYGSATTDAAAAVVERNGQVMVDSSGADDKIFTRGFKRTFAVLSPSRSYVGSMVEALDDLAEPRPRVLAFLSADDGFSKSATQAGIAKARALGFSVVAEEYVPNGATDVSRALLRIRPRNPDVIVVSAHVAEGVAAVKQARDIGVLPPGGFAETVAPPTPEFAANAGPAAEGVLGSTQWTLATKGSDKWFGSPDDYDAAFRAQFGGRAPEYHGAEATAACLAFVFAVEKAGTTEADAVRDVLAKLDESSFFGPLKFDEHGQNTTKPMGVVQIQGGQPIPVWPREAGTAVLKWPPPKP